MKYKKVIILLLLCSIILNIVQLYNTRKYMKVFNHSIQTNITDIFAALYSIFKGNIWGTCAFHSAWNWVQANLFVLASSAEKYLPKLFEIEILGSGSAIESVLLPEGEIIILIILVTLIGIMLIKMGKTNSRLKVMY